MVFFTRTPRLTVVHAGTRLNLTIFVEYSFYRYLDLVVIVDKTVSVTRLVEWLAVFNAAIHYCKNSGFTVQKFIFIAIFTLIAIR